MSCLYPFPLFRTNFISLLGSLVVIVGNNTNFSFPDVNADLTVAN